MNARRVIALVAALQFVCIADLMMLLPLGPDIAGALGFPVHRLGWLPAAYTVAAIAAGMVALRVLDRFDRRAALATLLVLFTVALALTASANDLATLLLARVAAGLVGGPMVAVGMAWVIDATAPERRGQAIGKVMMGFSAAAVVAVPAALELARLGGWFLPFALVAGLALALAVATRTLLPATPPAPRRGPPTSFRSLLSRAPVRAACALQALSQFAAFLVVPSFSAYLLLDAGLPRDRLGLLYAVGGVTALLALQALGRVADRRGPLLAIGLASVAMAIGLLPLLGVPMGASLSGVAATFVAFMAGNAGRNVALGAATSQVPAPHERAGFMALQNVVQDGAIAAASLLASLVLVPGEGGRLLHMPVVAGLSLALIAVLPALYAATLARPRPLAA